MKLDRKTYSLLKSGSETQRVLNLNLHPRPGPLLKLQLVAKRRAAMPVILLTAAICILIGLRSRMALQPNQIFAHI